MYTVAGGVTAVPYEPLDEFVREITDRGLFDCVSISVRVQSCI